jgi:[ribosomal protein S5]-alanine N-acetyltransferase
MSQVLSSYRLALELFTADMMRESLEGLACQRMISGFFVPTWWPNERYGALLQRRLWQLAQDPSHGSFLVRAIVLREEQQLVGHIGFHGPPFDGWLEMGYSVFSPHRRQGIAEEAARMMMRWATEAHQITRFRLSISPENPPSLAMAAKLGFQKIGEQWDEEDGTEWVFEVGG